MVLFGLPITFWIVLVAIVVAVIVVINTTINKSKKAKEDPYADLEKLTKLHNDGVINDAEFEEKKANLIAKM